MQGLKVKSFFGTAIDLHFVKRFGMEFRILIMLFTTGKCSDTILFTELATGLMAKNFISGFVVNDTIYYLLNNGTDSPTCGRSVSVACRTFEYLIDIFYNATHLSKLHLITEVSIQINAEFLVRCLSLFTFCFSKDASTTEYLIADHYPINLTNTSCQIAVLK